MTAGLMVDHAAELMLLRDVNSIYIPTQRVHISCLGVTLGAALTDSEKLTLVRSEELGFIHSSKFFGDLSSTYIFGLSLEPLLCCPQ